MAARPCLICAGDRTRTVERCEDPYAVVRCTSCGLTYVNPQPPVPAVDEHYDEGYYVQWRDQQAPARQSLWRRRLAEVKRYKAGGRLLDVGCGLGTLLGIARDAGYDPSGTEVSVYACRHVKEQYGIDVSNGDLITLDLPPASFDIITLWHTLEHMPDPLANLRVVRRLLKPDGIAVIAVPNVKNHVMRLVYPLVRGRRLRLFSIHDKELHLYHFSQQTLSLLVRKAGFEVLRTGLDLGQVSTLKRGLDFVALATRAFTGKNWSEGIKAYVRPA